MIAVHNNTEARYSARSYQPDGTEAAAAAAVAIADDRDPDDFVFTTDRTLFAHLEAAGENAVLQAPSPPDDGSLSVRLAGARYVNVEAQHGHHDAQRRLLQRVLEALEEIEAARPKAAK